MVERYCRYPVFSLYTIAIVLAFFAAFFNDHLNLPEGCDEFGYLNMAKAVSRGNLFKNHTERPFDSALIGHLRRSPYPYESYAYLICSHAHFIHWKGWKIINQYPPGTGVMLAMVPFEVRKQAFPAIAALLLVLFTAFAFRAGSGRLSLFHMNLLAVIALLVFFSSFIPHGLNSFNEVNSYAPTFGMLLAAGYLLDKKPGLSIVFLGMSTVFRIPNAILFLPFLFAYVGTGFRVREYFSKRAMVKTSRAAALLLAGGLGLYFMYVWILLGNPFVPTYSYVDQRFASVKEIAGNIAYYCSPVNRWFLVHVAVLGLIAVMGILKKIPARLVCFSMLTAAFNYCFYFVHRVPEEYYVYASGVIAAGILLGGLEASLRHSKYRRVIDIAGILAVLAAAGFTVFRFPRLDMQQQLEARIKPYSECFSGFDVVWAELRGGTVEYATGKAGFRFEWGPAAVRRDVLSWLHAHGYRQAIWVSDLEKSRAQLNLRDTVNVEAELKSIPLDYRVKECPELGTVIEVP
jgi:hypothetical protein